MTLNPFLPQIWTANNSSSYIVASLILPATLYSARLQTDRHNQMSQHVIQLLVNIASTIVSSQNKQGFEVKYCKQLMWYSEFKPCHYLCCNTQRFTTSWCTQTKTTIMPGYFADYSAPLSSNSYNTIPIDFQLMHENEDHKIFKNCQNPSYVHTDVNK